MSDVPGFIFCVVRTVTITVGLIGNALSFIIFSQPVFRKNSISSYCRALAIFDCFTINQLISDISLLTSNNYLPGIFNSYCKVFYYFSIGFSSIPGWILVIFSFDKMLSMRRTNGKFEFLKRRKFQFSVIVLIVFTNLLIYSEIPILLNIINVTDANGTISEICDVKYIPFANLVSAMYLIEASIIPFGLMTFISVVIVRSIRKSRKSLEKTTRRDSLIMKERKSRDAKFAVTSLTLNVLFVGLQLPLVLYYLFEFYGIAVPRNVYFLTIQIFFVNSSISFFVHFTTNSLFRKQFMIVLGLQKHQGHLDHTNMNSTQNVNVITVRPKTSDEKN